MVHDYFVILNGGTMIPITLSQHQELLAFMEKQPNVLYEMTDPSHTILTFPVSAVTLLGRKSPIVL